MVGSEGRHPRWIPPRMIGEPCCVQLWGNSRTGLNRAAWELASRVNPRYVWVDVKGLRDPVDPEDPAASGLVPPDQLRTTVDPASLEPDNPAANAAIWYVLRKDDDPKVLTPLMDFLRLPALLQELIGRPSNPEGHGAVVVANGDRLAQYYADEAEGIESLLNVWRRERVTLIATYFDLARKTRTLYDYAFKLDCPVGAKWTSSTLILEHGPKGENLPVGVPMPLL